MLKVVGRIKDVLEKLICIRSDLIILVYYIKKNKIVKQTFQFFPKVYMKIFPLNSFRD